MNTQETTRPEDDDKLTAILNEVKARCEAATRGPWTVTEKHGTGIDDEGWSDVRVKSPDGTDVAATYLHDLENYNADADEAFITSAREDVPRLVAALNAVLALHEPKDGRAGMECSECTDAYGDPADWPCATVEAITRELLGEETTDGR